MFRFLARRKRGYEKEECSETNVKKSNVNSDQEPLNRGLSKTRSTFFSKFHALFGRNKGIDDELLESLEEALIGSDVGVNTALEIISYAKEKLKAEGSVDESRLLNIVREHLISVLQWKEEEERILELEDGVDAPYVIMIVGVNGSGKTTTVGKLGQYLKNRGNTVLFCAADTFRAAAVEQLKAWGEMADIEVIDGGNKAKPSAVAYMGAEEAIKRGSDYLIVDTAGRLHTKSHLMAELEGIRNSLRRHISGAPHDVWLVLDGTSGQNAVIQAREFNKIVPLTGII
ncbi:MAG: signal recognition particle-docking protein FtsY, partial [Candidatus Dadabacteria bacterium]